MSARPPSLAELRLRLERGPGGAERERLLEALRADPRAGARRLAERHVRARERARAERRRLSALLARQRRLHREGARRVAGADEVGVGPLAGPLVAAAVVLPDDALLPGLDDSKRLDRARREALAEAVRARSLAWCVVEMDVAEVDRLNVYRAAQEAVRRALRGLDAQPDHVLVDGRPIPDLPVPQTALAGGDAREASIAAASILAKVHRDARMRALDAQFPGYGFARHKGYATREHREALARLGPCALHRRSFAPVFQPGLF